MDEKRIGIVGIVISDKNISDKVNDILHLYADIIVGRMGVPYKDRNVSVISLIVDGDSDQISALTGKLGKIDGIKVKSALVKG